MYRFDFRHHEKLTFEACLSFGLSLVVLFYAFSPFRLEPGFIFQNQTELLLVITVLSWAGCAGILIHHVYTSGFPKAVTLIDLLLFACLVYLLLQRLFYPFDKEYIFTIVCLAATYFLFRHIPAQLTAGLLCLLPVLAVVQMIYGYNRFSHPWQGISDIAGAFGNTGIFGGFVAMGWVAAAGLMRSAKRPVIRMALGTLLIPLTIQLLYSRSRAAWVAAGAGALMLLWPAFRKLTKPEAAMLISAALIAGILFSPKLYHFKKDSADGRLLIWTVSWNMIKEKPLTGFGPDGFRKNYLLYQGEYFKNHPDSPRAALADDTISPFNEFLKIGVEQGIVGWLFVAGMIFQAFGNTAKSSVFQAILAALIGFSCFSYPFEKLPFTVLLVFSLAVLSTNRNPLFVIQWRNRRYWRIPLLLALCLISWKMTGNVHRYAKSCLTWNRALTHLSSNREKSLAKLKEVYPELDANPIFLTTYGKALSISGHNQEAVVVLERAVQRQPLSFSYIELGKCYEAAGFSEKALECWEQAGLMVPARFTPLYLAMKLHFNTKEYGRAQEYAEQLLSKKIKIDHPGIDSMKREAWEILNFHPPPE